MKRSDKGNWVWCYCLACTMLSIQRKREEGKTWTNKQIFETSREKSIMKAIRSLQNKRKVALKTKQRNFHSESSIPKCANSIFPFCLKHLHLLVLLFARCMPFIFYGKIQPDFGIHEISNIISTVKNWAWFFVVLNFVWNRKKRTPSQYIFHVH